MEGYRPVDDFEEYVVPKPRTFQGRRLVAIKWEGAQTLVMEGLWVVGKSPKGAKEILFEVVESDGPMDLDGGRQAAKQAGGGVRWVEPVIIDSIAVRPNDTHYRRQWALEAVKAPQGWDKHRGDENSVLLAILDTGLPLQEGKLCHPDLSDEKRFRLGRNWVDGDDDPADDNGHGTHVLGIAGASTDNQLGIAGLLWKGQILVIKVSDSHGNASTLTLNEGVGEAIDYAASRGMRLVINYSSQGIHSELKKSAIEKAGRADAVIVAPAGNNKGEQIDYPAAYAGELSHVLAVGAVDRALNPANFSNVGPQMTVAAPGVDIFSTMPNYFVRANSEGYQQKYDLMSGTSMASPLVAALAALVWARFPEYSAEDVRDRIVTTAKALPGQDPNRVGRGLIDVERALS